MTLYFKPLYSLLLFFMLYAGCTETVEIHEEQPEDFPSELTPDSDLDDEDIDSFVSTDSSTLKYWNWGQIEIPPYSWVDGVKFGGELYVNIAFDPQGVRTQGNQLHFHLDPLAVPSGTPSDFNYRSEIHTAPWPINHPLGTEQWMRWIYTFGDDYVIDPTSPITIFQNHPGVTGLSPQIELEIAGLNNPSPAQGGEIQVINEASSDRIVYPVKPEAGDELEVVIHVIYGLGDNGLLQVWFNDTLYYNEKTSTIYEDYPWGGNNKWGVYHHTFNDSPADVQSSLDIGAGTVDLFMSPLRLMTRNPDHKEYGKDAYDLIRSVQ